MLSVLVTTTSMIDTMSVPQMATKRMITLPSGVYGM